MYRQYQTEAEWRAYEEGFEDAIGSDDRIDEIAETKAQVLFQAEMEKRYPRYGNQLLPCVIEGCEQFRHAKGLCGTHYERMRKWGDPSVRKKGAPQGRVAVVRCGITWCHREMSKRGLCHTHYHNWKKRDNKGTGNAYLKFLEDSGPPETRTGRDRGGVEMPAMRSLPIQREGYVDESVL